MAKYVNDSVMDAALDIYKTGKSGLGPCNKLVVCSGQPADFAGVASATLAEVAMDSADFTIGNGDISGRKVTVAAQNGLTVGTSGTADHVALVDTVNSILLAVTTCTPQALTASNTVNVPAFDIEIADPS